MTGALGSDIAMTIDAGGSFAGGSGGCNFTGTIQPRSSGKNVFNVSLTFGAAPCPSPGLKGSGVAFAIPFGTNSTQLLLAGYDASRTTGTVLFGNR